MNQDIFTLPIVKDKDDDLSSFAKAVENNAYLIHRVREKRGHARGFTFFPFR
jgi:hypothetical protein